MQLLCQEMRDAAVSPDSLVFSACAGACRRGSQGQLALLLDQMLLECMCHMCSETLLATTDFLVATCKHAAKSLHTAGSCT